MLWYISLPRLFYPSSQHIDYTFGTFGVCNVNKMYIKIKMQTLLNSKVMFLQINTLLYQYWFNTSSLSSPCTQLRSFIHGSFWSLVSGKTWKPRETKKAYLFENLIVWLCNMDGRLSFQRLVKVHGWVEVAFDRFWRHFTFHPIRILSFKFILCLFSEVRSA